MYAVIETGGKQYRVSEGSVIKVESLSEETGASVRIGRVLMLGDGGKVSVGRPLVENASVTAEVLGQGRGKKVISYKYRRRKDSEIKKGHRQNYTELKIKEIKGL